ncbi:MAG: hypothetical protein ACKVP3_24215 [Hyphomicrobiaceae bacterium]
MTRTARSENAAPITEALALLERIPALHRKVGSDGPEMLASGAREVISVLERVISTGKSEGVLLWPNRLDGVAIFHALAALNRLENSDARGFASLYFPWSQNVGATQRTLLIDRDVLVRSAMLPLQRVYSNRNDRSYAYLMSLHSLKHIGSSGKSDKRTKRALERDPLLIHPSLYEITPQLGITAESPRAYQEQFLRRLRRHTWIDDCPDHLEAVSDPLKAPFFMFGVHSDAVRIALWRQAGLDPKQGGRRPDVILLDLTRRARNRLGSDAWRQRVAKFCATAGDLYGESAPPMLALTDDAFVLQALRWETLKRYDVRRGASPDNKSPASALVILTPSSDLLSTASIEAGDAPEIVVEAYGGEILSFSDFGLKLRRRLVDAGDDELASAVIDGMHAVQNLIGLPGYPRQLMDFAEENYERFECQAILARYDRLAPRGKIKAALQQGLAGANQNALAEFLSALDKLFAAAESNNPGCELFDKCILRAACSEGRTLVVFSSELLRGFAEWRIEEDSSLAEIRTHLGSKILLVDRREAVEVLEAEADGDIDRIVFMEPGPDDLLSMLARSSLPKTLVVLAHLARVENTLRRTRVLLQLDGIEKVRPRLEAVAAELERVLAGRKIDLPDLDAAPPLPRLGTLDLTAIGAPGSGRTRILSTSGGFKIRAFDGSEFARYDPDALQVFTRCDASDLKQGDQICVFTPDFVESAREKLHLAAKASDILLLYHRDVANAASRLPGVDMAGKVQALRDRMLGIEPSLQLPGLQSIRSWIDVTDLLEASRETVRPQAPRVRRHFVCMMKALGISDDVARHYWDLGVFWTRSMRIRNGAAFHQVFMGILIDPHGTAAWLPPDRRKEIWQIYETAENHVLTVTANERETDST